MEVADSFEAQQVLQSLRQGTVSKRHARRLMIGRQFWVDALSEDLDFVANGASKIRFLSAPYGGGKTHLLSSIEDVAIEKGFVVANIELHSREAPLDRFEVVFPKIMRSLKCASGTGALQQVFRHWLDSADLYNRSNIDRELKTVSPSFDFQAALRAFVERADGDRPEDQEIVQAVLGWLCGDPLSSLLRQHARIRNRISITNVSEIFGSFLNLVHRSGFRGAAVFLDEAEAVTSLTQSRKRDEANQNIRKLLDNADRYQGLLIVFSTTPTFLDDPERGAKSYTALWDRIRTVVKIPKGMKPNKRTLIIELEPPGKRELKKIATSVVSLHSKAYNWHAEESLPDLAVSQLVEKYVRSSPVAVYRPFLRTVIAILDAAEQGAGADRMKTLVSEIEFGTEDVEGTDGR